MGPWSTTKMLKNHWKNVHLRLRGVPGGHPGKTPKTAAWVGKVVQNGGVPNGVARGPGPPPGAPSGVPKGVTLIDPIGFGPCWFPRGSIYIVFIVVSVTQPKISHSLPGASTTRFSADLGRAWGAQGPPWDFRVVFWGALGPPRGPFIETGRGQEGPRGALVTSGRAFPSFGVIQKYVDSIGNMCKMVIWGSPEIA